MPLRRARLLLLLLLRLLDAAPLVRRLATKSTKPKNSSAI
jgi:hypothetical protein